MSSRRSNRTLFTYLIAVCAVGFPALAVTIALDAGRLLDNLAAFLFLLPCIAFAEFVPIRIPRGDYDEELTVSTTFAFAMLLIAGPGAALVGMAVASLVSDVGRRRPRLRASFNVAQYSLSILAAFAVLHAFGVTPRNAAVSVSELGPLALAALTFFALNNSLPGIALALDRGLRGTRIVRFLAEDVAFQAGMALALISMAPLVVAAAHDSLILILLLGAPLLAIYRSAAALARASHEALHDPLTGLANRTRLHLTMASLFDEHALAGTSFALLLVDLDRFKEVNDALGHAVGDELLQLVALRLRACVGDEDLVVRLGGDEFAVVLASVESTTASDRTVALLSGLEAPMELETVTLDVTASIGVAIAPAHGTDAPALLGAADAALYLAKEARAGFVVHDAQGPADTRGRLLLLADLHEAYTAKQFVVHFQPKADARTRKIVGVEALVRWQHPRLGLLAPSEFIGMLEQSGLIRQVTLDVIDESLKQLAEWRRAGWKLHVAVNTTVRSLHDRAFPEAVASLLAAHKVPASFLELEVTERTLMADPKLVSDVLQELKTVGIRLGLDDFGTGFSSLAHLGRLPLDELKIDQSFVLGLISSDTNKVIVRSTIELAKSLGMTSVAEGVEDEVTWRQLRALGCNVVQGYLISRPKPADEITALLRHLGPEPVIPLGGVPIGPDANPTGPLTTPAIQRG